MSSGALYRWLYHWLWRREVPPFSRFYMGGENDIRGFDIRSISPVTFIPTATTQSFIYTGSTTLNANGTPDNAFLECAGPRLHHYLPGWRLAN